MPALLRVAAAFGLLVFVAGCGETTFQDVFGAGKDAPDESQVRTNQALTLPPDLSLKAPGTGTPPPPPPQPVRVASSAVHGTTTASLTPAAPATAAAPAAPGAAAPATAATPPGAAPAADQDIYARYGISRNRPDGTPKKPAELREELRQKYVEMQRAKNPNYGTVLNMGNIWSDQ
jgi:hypothetical protein